MQLAAAGPGLVAPRIIKRNVTIKKTFVTPTIELQNLRAKNEELQEDLAELRKKRKLEVIQAEQDKRRMQVSWAYCSHWINFICALHGTVLLMCAPLGTKYHFET